MYFVVLLLTVVTCSTLCDAFIAVRHNKMFLSQDMLCLQCIIFVEQKFLKISQWNGIVFPTLFWSLVSHQVKLPICGRNG